MEKDENAVLALSHFLEGRKILSEPGKLEQALAELESATKRSSSDVSALLKSNLNSFLHICHMLNQSEFLKQESEDVYFKMNELLQKLKFKLREKLEKNLLVKIEFLENKEKQEFLIYAEYSIKMISETKAFAKKISVSQQKLNLGQATILKSKCKRSSQVILKLEALSKAKQNLSLASDLSLEGYLKAETKEIADLIYLIIKRLCFETSPANFEEELQIMNLIFGVSNFFGLEEKIQSFVNNFVDLIEAETSGSLENTFQSFVQTKSQEAGLISQAIAKFVKTILLEEPKILHLMKFQKSLAKFFFRALVKIFEEILKKAQEKIKNSVSNFSLKDLKLVFWFLNLPVEFSKILNSNRNLNEIPSNIKFSNKKLDNFKRMIFELFKEKEFVNLKQVFLSLKIFWLEKKTAFCLQNFETAIQSFEKIQKEEKKEIPFKLALQKFEAANKKTLEASLIENFANSASGEFLDELFIGETLKFLRQLRKRAERFLIELAKKISIDDFILFLEYVFFVLIKMKKIFLEVLKKIDSKNIDSVILAIEKSLEQSEDKLSGELTKRLQNFEVSNKTIKQLEAIKGNSSYHKYVLKKGN